MADVKLNPAFEQLSGKLGDLVFRRYGKRTIMSPKADTSDREWSEAQIAHRERFREAVVYGRTVMADPETRALYDEAAQEAGKPLFSMTIGDFFNAPSIDRVDVSSYAGKTGDEVTIAASDDFEVVGVEVVITDGDGALIEEGAAVDGGNGQWIYTATADVEAGTDIRMLVRAHDRPGGTGEDETEVSL